MFDRSIDNQVSRLRKKIEPDPRRPQLIKTHWGGGYSFTADVTRAVRRLWPRSLAGPARADRAGGAAWPARLLSVLIFADERRVALRAANREQVLARTAGLVRLLEETPAALHQRILGREQRRLRALRHRADERGRRWTTPGTAATASRGSSRRLLGGNGGRPVLVDFADERPGHQPDRLRAVDERDRRGRATGSAPPAATPGAASGGAARRWAAGSTPRRFPQPAAGLGAAEPGLAGAVGSTGRRSACVLAVRRVTRPMTRLAAAADALGRGEASPPLPEAGPADVRRTVAAFNRMQARLRRFVDDRTRMLAAISHDLRTPITSLRLRAEFVEDDETRAAHAGDARRDADDGRGTLAFAREEAAERADAGGRPRGAGREHGRRTSPTWAPTSSFAGRGRLPYACRPVALRRALRNLIENAVRYGGARRVRLERGRDERADRDRGRRPRHSGGRARARVRAVRPAGGLALAARPAASASGLAIARSIAARPWRRHPPAQPPRRRPRRQLDPAARPTGR